MPAVTIVSGSDVSYTALLSVCESVVESTLLWEGCQKLFDPEVFLWRMFDRRDKNHSARKELVMGLVLIAEDEDKSFEEMFVETLEEMGLRFVRAKTLQEAIILFDENKEDLIGIVVDGCLNSNGILDGPYLVEHVRRQGWSGIIIPASQSDDNNAHMVELGATRKPYAENFRAKKESAIDLLLREMRKAKLIG